MDGWMERLGCQTIHVKWKHLRKKKKRRPDTRCWLLITVIKVQFQVLQVRFVINEVALEQVSLQFLRFLLLITTHHCSIFTDYHPTMFVIALTDTLGPKLGASSVTCM
jgi:hypothetical protein